MTRCGVLALYPTDSFLQTGRASVSAVRGSTGRAALDLKALLMKIQSNLFNRNSSWPARVI